LLAHERSLVERYRGQPFVVLGVNLDRNREVLRRVQEKEQLNFRSWWDGPGGPIARHWDISALPAVFLLDHRGVIRFETQGVPDREELERKIDRLIREARAEG
jgi:hypothetical protein